MPLRKIYSQNQELGNLKRFPVKRALMQGIILGSGIGKVSGVSGIK
jgi:hypothetical protein